MEIGEFWETAMKGQLIVNGVECCYGSRVVLEDVELRVNSGEMVGILGPNGAGKTTLLRTISKALKPSLGAVLLDGRDIYTMGDREIAREMAVVHQTSASVPNFTALEVVLMGRNPFLKRLQLEGEEDLDISRQAMELTGTWHLANRLILELSGGERQKITIARAITQQPKVLLLDEPTLHLDIASQIEIMDLVKGLCSRKGLTVISVFHDFNLAARYCSKIMLVGGGKIVAAGRPQDVLTRSNISKIYGVEVSVKRHPITGSLYTMPLAMSTKLGNNQTKGDIHVICGGGTGAEVMHRLVESGWHVSAGVLNLLDTDFESAEALKVSVISEAPFSNISEEASKENLKKIYSAAAVIVTDFPVGYGNLNNLDAALSAVKKGIPTIIIKGSIISERDFTKGEATAYYKRLIDAGALIAENVDDALKIAEKYNQRSRTR
jgi:iron complex transport system ATP-binding protein